MKTLLNDLLMPGLTIKQKAAAWYFVLSLCLLMCTGDNSSLWAVAIVVANFCIAALTIRKHKPFNTNNHV